MPQGCLSVHPAQELACCSKWQDARVPCQDWHDGWQDVSLERRQRFDCLRRPVRAATQVPAAPLTGQAAGFDVVFVSGEFFDPGCNALLVENEKFMEVAMQTDWNGIDLQHFDHATAGRNRSQGPHQSSIVEFQLIGIGMFRPVIQVTDLHFQASLFEFLLIVLQAPVIGFPSEQAPRQAKIRTLRGVSSHQGTGRVIVDHHPVHSPLHQGAGQTPDAQRSRAM